MDLRSSLMVLAVVAILSGCADDPANAVPQAAIPMAETIEEQPIDVYATSSLYVCPGCVGVFGDDVGPVPAQGDVLGFDVEVRLRDDLSSPALGPLAQVRATAFCLGERLSCPPGPLASAEGRVPLALKADGFRILQPDQLAFRIEYLGPVNGPVNGSGASYQFIGLATVAVQPAADEPED
jgi:hypothetical protein